MHIASGIDMLEITVQIMGGSETIYPTLLWEKDAAVLVDTGYPGLLPKFKEALEEAGVPWTQLRTLIITHQDLDHIGSLPALLAEPGLQLTVLSHQIEKPYIEGDALTVKNGELHGPDPAATPDMDRALLSLTQLADYEIDKVICYHGGLYRGEANRRISELALGLGLS